MFFVYRFFFSVKRKKRRKKKSTRGFGGLYNNLYTPLKVLSGPFSFKKKDRAFNIFL